MRANAKNQARKGPEREGRGNFQERGQEGVSEKVTSDGTGSTGQGKVRRRSSPSRERDCKCRGSEAGMR